MYYAYPVVLMPPVGGFPWEVLYLVAGLTGGSVLPMPVVSEGLLICRLDRNGIVLYCLAGE